MDPFRAAEMAIEIQLARIQVTEAMNARDAAVQRLADAYTSIRQKTAIVQQLQREKDVVVKTPQNSALVSGEVDKRSEAEISRLEGIIQGLQEEIRVLKNSTNASPTIKNSPEPPPSYEEGTTMSQKAICGSEYPSAQRSFIVSNDSCNSASVHSAAPFDAARIPNTVPSTPEIRENTKHILRESSDLNYAVIPTLPASEEPAARMKARHAILAKLPIPSGIPDDALIPILIRPPMTLHEFLGSSLGPLGNSLLNYRVFQQLTTSWCPQREEHGYFLTPAFKCSTNPRVATAHRWATVDIVGKLNKPTECFYNKDGKWYYAGVYIGFRLEDLTPKEWEALSNETIQLIIKETLAARKNVSPQNLYETAQLYAAGALRVGCVGLKCVGFNNVLYRAVLEQVGECAGFETETGKREIGPLSAGGVPGGASIAEEVADAVRKEGGVGETVK